MKKITDDELKSISVEILKNVDSFCRDNGIDYSYSVNDSPYKVRYYGNHKGYPYPSAKVEDVTRWN